MKRSDLDAHPVEDFLTTIAELRADLAEARSPERVEVERG